MTMKNNHIHISLCWRSFVSVISLIKLLRTGSYTDQYGSVCTFQLYNLIFIQHCTPFSIKKSCSIVTPFIRLWGWGVEVILVIRLLDISHQSIVLIKKIQMAVCLFFHTAYHEYRTGDWIPYNVKDVTAVNLHIFDRMVLSRSALPMILYSPQYVTHVIQIWYGNWPRIGCDFCWLVMWPST